MSGLLRVWLSGAGMLLLQVSHHLALACAGQLEPHSVVSTPCR